MSGEIINEVRLFTTSVVLGAALTFLYDGFLILRNVFKHNMFWMSVEDLFFWTVTGIVVFLALQKENHGELRGYIIVGACAGMLLYKNAISGFYVKYVSGSALHIVVYIKRMAYFVSKPILRAQKCVKSGVLASEKGIKKVTIILKNWLTVCIKWFTIALCKHNGENGDLHNDEET